MAKKMRGQALLTIVLLIGSVVLAGGISVALATASFVNATYGYESATQAEAIAVAGAEDGLLQLARNNEYGNPTGYQLPVGSSTATVTVLQNTPAGGFSTVLSQATVFGRTKKIQMVVAINPVTGQASVVSWNEIQ